MTTNEIILGVAALILVGFSLVVALVLPRRNPDFPGNRVGLFTLVALVLVAGMLAAVEVAGSEEEREDVAHAENPVTEAQDVGEPGEEAGGTGAEEEGAEGGGGAAAAEGRQIFADSGCGNCHILEAAGAEGTVGPNLDETKPSEEAVVEQVTNGGNGMPAFADQLSPEEIRAVAAFVAESTK